MNRTSLSIALAGALSAGCGNGSAAEDAALPTIDAASAVSDASPLDASIVDASPADAAVDAAVDAAPVCDCAVGEYCDTDSICQAGPVPLGGHCGPTIDCLLSDPDAVDCHNAQCISNNCARVNTSAFILRNTCTQACTIYQDNDGDGVNDSDAPTEDCQPSTLGEGMFNTEFRCVNFAPPQNIALAMCVPGSSFLECISNSDCPANEACELSTMRGAVGFNCIGRYVESGGWAHAVVRLGDSCNDDPTQGALVYCQDGSCNDGLCSANCASNEHCDTSAIHPEHRCVSLECENAPGTTCAVDSDCSTMECGGSSPANGGVPAFQYCTAKL